jgi:hypothetical protein
MRLATARGVRLVAASVKPLAHLLSSDEGGGAVGREVYRLRKGKLVTQIYTFVMACSDGGPGKGMLDLNEHVIFVWEMGTELKATRKKDRMVLELTADEVQKIDLETLKKSSRSRSCRSRWVRIN